MDDAVDCRVLGSELLYVRYQTEDGEVGRTQLGLGQGSSQASDGLSESAMEVLRLRGWDEAALSELQEGEDLSADVQDRLEEMPSCLDELRDGDDLQLGD